MNFISFAFLFVVLSISLTSHSESVPVKTPLEICAEKKLKDFRVRNLVSVADEPVYLDKFKQACAKEQMAANQDKQVKDAVARAEKEEKKVVAAPTKPASADQTTTSAGKPVFGPVPSQSSSGSGSGGFVIGGCGTPEQCAAYMAEANTPKYTWSSPGLQAYLGELWGNNFNYAHGLGGTYEQPENACNEKNQGEMIALDTGTELVAVACMSSHASQEELKKMAEKIKNTKVDTLPTVVAVKKPKYEWKVITEAAKLEEGQFRVCTGAGTCGSESVGKVFNEGNGCAVYKCIRIDGGPVKVAKKDEKNNNPAADTKTAPTEAPRAPAQQEQPYSPPHYQSFDVNRDGAAGP